MSINHPVNNQVCQCISIQSTWLSEITNPQEEDFEMGYTFDDRSMNLMIDQSVTLTCHHIRGLVRPSILFHSDFYNVA